MSIFLNKINALWNILAFQFTITKTNEIILLEKWTFINFIKPRVYNRSNKSWKTYDK